MSRGGVGRGRLDRTGLPLFRHDIMFSASMENAFFLAEEPLQMGPAKIRSCVKLGLADGRVMNADIYLLCDSVRPSGITTIESTLDGLREFIPVNVEGENVLLSRSAIRFVDMPADAPGAGDLQDVGGTLDVVKL